MAREYVTVPDGGVPATELCRPLRTQVERWCGWFEDRDKELHPYARQASWGIVKSGVWHSPEQVGSALHHVWVAFRDACAWQVAHPRRPGKVSHRIQPAAVEHEWRTLVDGAVVKNGEPGSAATLASRPCKCVRVKA